MRRATHMRQPVIQHAAHEAATPPEWTSVPGGFVVLRHFSRTPAKTVWVRYGKTGLNDLIGTRKSVISTSFIAKNNQKNVDSEKVARSTLLTSTTIDCKKDRKFRKGFAVFVF